MADKSVLHNLHKRLVEQIIRPGFPTTVSQNVHEETIASYSSHCQMAANVTGEPWTTRRVFTKQGSKPMPEVVPSTQRDTDCPS